MVAYVGVSQAAECIERAHNSKLTFLRNCWRISWSHWLTVTPYLKSSDSASPSVLGAVGSKAAALGPEPVGASSCGMALYPLGALGA